MYNRNRYMHVLRQDTSKKQSLVNLKGTRYPGQVDSQVEEKKTLM